MSKELEVGRQITVRGMAYAPTSEQDVVFLFGRLAPALGFCIERVQIRFPDCLATRRGKKCRIEFEYWASDFERHGHDLKNADCVVCWHNDWESRRGQYKRLEIIELKRFVDALPGVFVVGCQESRGGGKELDKRSRTEWNVPTNAERDDLVIMYRAGKDSGGRPAMEIRDLWKIVGPFRRYGKVNKEGRWPGLQAGLRLVVRLKKPVTYAELCRDRNTRDLGVVRKRFIGKTDVTDYWAVLYNKIVSLNPKAKSPLRRWRFD
jgi:hypothetical protein